jgi:hypothetical protein
MNILVPDYHFLKEGKDCHRIVQDHVARIEDHKYLKNIKVEFPIVEEVNFDSRCKFEFELVSKIEEFSPYVGLHKLKGKYKIIGFYDGRLEDYSKTMEGKFSSTPWTIGKFKKDIQRKIYALSNNKIKEQFLITGYRDVEKWKTNPLKISSLKPTEKDKMEAAEWIIKGIEILEKGDFTGGLDKNGKCTGCFWNMERYPHLANCNFL